MPHLNLDLDYFDHRKTKRLVGLLGKGAEVLPIRLWNYCGKFHAEDGRLSGYSDQEIESAVGWWGEPGKAVDAMLAVIFLEKINDGYQAHDWIEHQGHIAAYKAKGRAMALARWGRAESNAVSIADTAKQQCQSRPREPTKRTKSPPAPRGGKGKAPTQVEFFDLIPDPLRVPQFLESWASWLKHRAERKPRYTAEAARRALPKLAAEGVEQAVERIDRSIANGWQGLFFSGDRNGSAAGVNGHRQSRREEQMSAIDRAIDED